MLGRALDLVASELARVKRTWSNQAIFGGSTAGRAPAASTTRRARSIAFLNSIPAATRHQDSTAWARRAC